MDHTQWYYWHTALENDPIFTIYIQSQVQREKKRKKYLLPIYLLLLCLCVAVAVAVLLRVFPPPYRTIILEVTLCIQVFGLFVVFQ